MGRITYANDVAAPPEIAFEYTESPASVSDWLLGVTAFDAEGPLEHGAGARFIATFGLLPLRPKVTCEITSYRRGVVLGYTLRGRPNCTLTVRFDPLGHDSSVMTIVADYPPRHAGWAGRLPGTAVDAFVAWAVRRTENRLRREIAEFHDTDLVGRIA
ncbi:SRPBCC family protein [Nocardia callitridis]|uniref:SRPBCC family protein n=1 Tax=Nocardia callitridis TaxID=648753 RepID=A0ABP9JYA4_9NOCA